MIEVFIEEVVEKEGRDQNILYYKLIWLYYFRRKSLKTNNSIKLKRG